MIHFKLPPKTPIDPVCFSRASGDGAVINQLEPLWNGEQLQQAFDGSAMGNQATAMRYLAARGASLKAGAPTRELGDNTPVDNATTFALRTGAVEMLN